MSRPRASSIGLLAALLVASVAGNGVLATAALRARRHVTAESSAGTAKLKQPETTPSASTAAVLPWSEFTALPDEQLVQRLKQAGFGQDEVRAIIITKVERAFRPRFEAVVGVRPHAYWRQSSPLLAREVRAAARALHREQAELLRRLLGDELETDYERAERIRHFGPIAPEKHAELEALLRDYNEMQLELRMDSGRLVLPEDRARLELLEREKQADLETLLTPEELHQYELRNSRTTGMLHQQLKAFEPTEAEFLTLYDLHRQAESSGSNNIDRAVARAREGELQAEIARRLGPERYSEFQLKTDRAWMPTERFVRQHDLPAALTEELVRTQRDTNRRAEELRQTPGLSADARRGQLLALAAEAEARLRSSLGHEDFTRYQGSAGRWLKDLQTASRPAGSTHPPSNP